jgi:hypothetical protein
MGVQAKLKHNIARLLAKLISNIDDAIPYCEAAGLNMATIALGNAAYTDWRNIVNAADAQEGLLVALLKEILTNYSGNPELSSLYDEVKEGFDRRVELIAKAIRSNQCVLFLGPELLQTMKDGQVVSFSRDFSLQLAHELHDEGVYYDDSLKDTLPYVAQRFEEMPTYVLGEVGAKIKTAFQQATIYEQVYHALSTFAFPLIINTNPDSIIDKIYQQKAFDGQPVNLVRGCYDMTNDSDISGVLEGDFTKPNTIVSYKIFGSFENPASILFTDTHRVQFSKNVVRNDPPLPPMIKKMLANKYYLFIGFNFSEWHLKILIDCLGLAKNQGRSFALTATPGSSGVSANEYFEKEYNFYFIEKDIERFIRQIKTAFDEL